MSVRRRLIWSLVTLVGCTALLGAVAIIGLLGLSGRYGAAEEQYAQLRSLYEIGYRGASVRLLLDAGAAEGDAVQRHLFIAAQEADKLVSGSGASGRAHDAPDIEGVRLSIRARLEDVARGVGAGADLRADVNRWLGQVAQLTAATQSGIVENRRLARAGFTAAMWVMGGVFAATVLLAVTVGVSQYRAVMGPLGALDEAVTQVAGNRFGHRIREGGDREFRRLMRHFNRMSDAVERLHSSMRQQVEAKSRQLLRSEQLAGVGSLAAGLAHEINNPLGIIAGYAQTSLRRLERAGDAREVVEAIGRTKHSLRIIAEEAFRGRDIGVQLLSLARPADRDPEVVSLGLLAGRAVELVGRLPVAQGRELRLRCGDAPEDLVCLGHPAQLLQVLINLLTNGLEACLPDGRVVLTVERAEGHVLAAVADNGCGMSGETLARAFDPFFTDKPRRGLSGSGLGLSVSHAIVGRHGGRLYAHSDGPGRGSVFTAELPVAEENLRGGVRLERSDAGVA